MNYELAKQLKGVGFPMPIDDCEFAKGVDNDEIGIPTLSELIEACRRGKGGLLILSIQDDGCAVGYQGLGAKGKTPEEAVAKLWLELNKSK